MNAQNEGGSDSKSYGKRITEFGVTVVNIWRKEVQAPICNFWKVARGIFGNIFENPRGFL
jgi:hypothetical protein